MSNVIVYIVLFNTSQHSFPYAGCSRLLLTGNKTLVGHNGGNRMVWCDHHAKKCKKKLAQNMFRKCLKLSKQLKMHINIIYWQHI